MAFGLFGLAVLIGIAWLASNNKRRVDWKLVATGVGLQIAFAALMGVLYHLGVMQAVVRVMAWAITLTRPQTELADSSVKCPCVWKTEGATARPVAIPKYNNENRWYIEKYQSIVSLFE